MRKSVLILACLSFGLLACAPVAEAETCLALVQVVGSKSPDKAHAMSNAVRQWKLEVRSAHGAMFAVWQTAKRKRVMCYNVAAPTAPPMHQCKAMARPCGTYTLNPDLNGVL